MTPSITPTCLAPELIQEYKSLFHILESRSITGTLRDNAKKRLQFLEDKISYRVEPTYPKRVYYNMNFRLVFDFETGIFYEGFRQAAKSVNISESTLRKRSYRINGYRFKYLN